MYRRTFPLAWRFWSKVQVRGLDECWPWLDKPGADGYGRFNVGTGLSPVLAHRFAWVQSVGQTLLEDGPEPDTLDHTCHNETLACRGGVTCPHRLCCNPYHLEATTRAENVRRGRTNRATMQERTHCRNGHEYTDANTYWWRGKRRCRACNAAYLERCKAR